MAWNSHLSNFKDDWEKQQDVKGLGEGRAMSTVRDLTNEDDTPRRRLSQGLGVPQQPPSLV